MSSLVLTKENFDQEVLKSDPPVLVDFWADWCQPCQMVLPVIEELAIKFKRKIKIAKINIKDPSNREIAERYQVQSIPNLKLFKKGKIIKEFIGLVSKEELEKELVQLLK